MDLPTDCFISNPVGDIFVSLLFLIYFWFLLIDLTINFIQFRHKKCRPLNFWTEEQKEKFIGNEGFSYTVWRAANAIMDVRMEDMNLQIKARLDAGEKLKDMKFVAPGCYREE